MGGCKFAGTGHQLKYMICRFEHLYNFIKALDELKLLLDFKAFFYPFHLFSCAVCIFVRLLS